MKKLTFLIALLTAFNLNSQKKELRQVDKLISQSFFDEANNNLSEIQTLVLSSEDKYKADFYFFKSRVSNELENFDEAIASYNNLKLINSAEYSNKVKTEFELLKDQIETSLVNSAVADNQGEKYSEASTKLYMAYNLNKEKNQDYLYYAAGSAVNSKNYDKALLHYLELKDLNYTGIVTEYFVTNVSSGVEEKVSESEYKVFEKSKEYNNPSFCDVIGSVIYDPKKFKINFLENNYKTRKKPSFSGFFAWLDQYI